MTKVCNRQIKVRDLIQSCTVLNASNAGGDLKDLLTEVWYECAEL